MEIKGFVENSLIEWEGKISCVIFLPLCNLRCRYCHAAHLLNPVHLESVPLDQVRDCMRRHKGWLDGAVLTGGEPTLHGEELLDLIRDIRATGLQVMVETNGTRPEWVRRLISEKWIDAVSMDVKAPFDAESYRAVTGRPVEIADLRSSIECIIGSGIPHEFRITVVPGLVGPQEVELIAPELRGAEVVALQNFKPDFCLDAALRKVRPFAPEEMDSLAGILSGVAKKVVVRGRERALSCARASSESGGA